MTHPLTSRDTLEVWLQLTHEEEIDCDRFAMFIAPMLDQTITDPRLLELLEHHRRLCADCEEEVRLVESALGKAG